MGLFPECNINNTITTADHQCILPGLDNSLDLYANLESWVELGLDEIFRPNPNPLIQHENEVRAGLDLLCQTVPRENNVHNFNPNIDEDKLEVDLNTIYNKIGIQVELNYGGVINANYDSYIDDLILDASDPPGQLVIEEGFRLRFAMHEENPPVNRVAYIVPRIEKDFENADGEIVTQEIRGRALGFQSNILVLSKKNMITRTFSHESGHAFFGLHHPDDDHIFDDLNAAVDCSDGGPCDKYNLMNSGNIYSKTVKDLDEYRWRKYQWIKIFNNF